MIMLIALSGFVFGLAGCGSGSSNAHSAALDAADEYASSASTEQEEGYSEKSAVEERRSLEFDMHYSDWLYEEEQMRIWLDSGQQHEEWLTAMNDFINEVQSYPISEIPENYQVLYSQLLERVMDLRDEGM